MFLVLNGWQKKLGMKNRSVVYTLWDEDQKGRGLTFDGGEILILQGLSDGQTPS